MGRPLEIIADDRDAAEDCVARDAEQRPVDLLPLLPRFGQSQGPQQRQDRDDHEADEEGLVDSALKEHQDWQGAHQCHPPPRQVAVGEEQDAGQQQDVAEVEHGNVEPSRDADGAQEHRRRLLGGNG